MKKIIIIYLLEIISASGFSQSYSPCKVFKNLIPPDLLTKGATDISEISKGDTVYIDESFLKTQKQSTETFYSQEFLRDANKKEMKDFDHWKDWYHKRNLTLVEHIIDKDDKLLIRNNKIYSITKIENPYPDWYITKVVNATVLQYIKALPVVDQVTRYKTVLKKGQTYEEYEKEEIVKKLSEKGISEEQIYDAYDRISLYGLLGYARPDQFFPLDRSTSINKMISTEVNKDNPLNGYKLNGTLLPKNSMPLNPETLLNKPIIVNSTNKNTPYFHFRTLEDKMIIFYCRNVPDSFPIFKSKNNLVLSERRNKLIQVINNSESIKLQKFVLDIFKLNTNYFKLKSIILNDDQFLLKTDYYSSNDKILKPDSIIRYDSTTVFYDFKCAYTVHNDITELQMRRLLFEKIKRERYLKSEFTSKEVEFINKGGIFIDMSEKAMLESLGYPYGGINETVLKGLIHKQYVYSFEKYVYVENGKVTAWQKFDFGY